LILSILLAACSDEKKADHTSADPVVIGFLGPLTGQDETRGKDYLQGCRFILDKVQKEGNFKFIELVTSDDQNNPTKVRESFRKLVEQEKVSAVLAASDSRTMLNLLESADQYEIPILSLSATHPEITESPFISQLLFDDITQGTVAALYVIDEMLIDSVAVIKDSRDPHSDMLAATFTKKFIQSGGKSEVIDIAKFGLTLEAELRSFKANHIPFLYLPMNAEEVIETVKTLRKIGYKPQMMVSDGLLGQIYDRFHKNIDDIDGMFATDVSSIDLISSAFGKELIEEFQEKMDQTGTSFTLAGAEGMMIMLNAAKRCAGNETPECINTILHSTSNFQGVFGKLTINKEGKAERAIYISQINNGYMHVVVKVY